MTPWLVAATSLLCALMGGIFYAFSSFVMSALERIPAAEGIRAMQRINVDVYHWTFMAGFFGTPILCIVTAVLASRGSHGQAGLYAIVACVMYVVGNFLVTAAASYGNQSHFGVVVDVAEHLNSVVRHRLERAVVPQVLGLLAERVEHVLDLLFVRWLDRANR